MNKKLLSLLIVLAFVIVVVPRVSAVPPVTTTQQFTTGYIIEHQPQDYLKLSRDYTINFFVRNISNGKLVDDTTTNCSLYLSNDQGVLLLNVDVPYLPEDYWSYTIDGGNFSEVGIYPHGIACDGVTLGGSDVHAWEITSTGESFDITESIFYSAILAVLSFFFVICLYIAAILPSRNETTPEGEILHISQLKYFKPLAFLGAWALATIISFIGMGVGEAYMGASLISGIFRMIFTLLFSGFIVAIPVITIYLIWRAIKDGAIKQGIERGLSLGTS